MSSMPPPVVASQALRSPPPCLILTHALPRFISQSPCQTGPLCSNLKMQHRGTPNEHKYDAMLTPCPSGITVYPRRIKIRSRVENIPFPLAGRRGRGRSCSRSRGRNRRSSSSPMSELHRRRPHTHLTSNLASLLNA